MESGILEMMVPLFLCLVTVYDAFGDKLLIFSGLVTDFNVSCHRIDVFW